MSPPPIGDQPIGDTAIGEIAGQQQQPAAGGGGGGSTVNFRRTLSLIGTRSGTRQVINKD